MQSVLKYIALIILKCGSCSKLRHFKKPVEACIDLKFNKLLKLLGKKSSS